MRLQQPLLKRLGCLCNSCACAFGIISIVTFVMEDEVRFLWWLLLFHLRLIEECAIEVLAIEKWRQAFIVTPVFFPPLYRRAEPSAP